ncbi:hypothetical protein [Leminorella grimontii]|uniref:hypothetical protein n=1 Tax=Leminorella grimontii TaxID=82981 RepID=UPI00208CEB9B|nr:hypothetical protein [Leminorella grimontii]GKX57869.1 hypothetical protein SOASR031_01840 [Leminorella grimontii]
MTEVKYAYHLKRSAILLGILFFGWFTGFSYQQIDQTSNWLEVGRSATLTVEQTKTLLAATTAIFALLTIMSLIALANSFISSRCRLIFGDSAVSYPKGHVFPKTIEVPYRDIISIERVNAQFNEAMAVTTLQGKHVIQKGMMKNEAAFTEAYEYLKKKIEAKG